MKVKATTFIILTVLLPYSIHARKDPSPKQGDRALIDEVDQIPSNGLDKEKVMSGSLAAKCHSKCQLCRPCKPVGVRLQPTKNEYYPEVWRCMCQDKLFSP